MAEGWVSEWRYRDDEGRAWPGGSEVAQAATYATRLGGAALRVAQRVGTPTHQGIEGLLRQRYHDEAPAPLPADADATRVPVALGAWMSWYASAAGAPCLDRAPLDLDEGPERIEAPYWHHGRGVAGTIDAIWRDRDGRAWVIDWKTSGRPRGAGYRRLLARYRVQLAGYLALVDGDIDDVGGACIVTLPSTTEAAADALGAIEHVYTVAELAPESAIAARWAEIFWLRAEAARARGGLICGRPAADLRPAPTAVA